MKNKLLIIQHEASTPAGTTLEWAKNHSLEVVFWHPAQESLPPSLEGLCGAVICGGGMDTFEEERFPWLKTEKAYLRQLLDHKIKIFGLCLGSQLLAEILGGRVYQHPGWEIGFIRLSRAGQEPLPVFHWHHCTFDLPPGAELILQGDYCRNQAFKVGDQVIATQFHPEATQEWIRECAGDVKEKHQGNVQSTEEMLRDLPLQKVQQAWYFQQLDQLFLGK